MASCKNPSPDPSAARPSWHWLDGLSVCASSLCTLHCLALPLLFMLLPALATRVDPGESFHLLMIGLAAPVSLFALVQGWRRHRAIGIPSLGLAGLLCLAIGVFAADSALAEASWTVSGSLMLGIAHSMNWRRTRICRRARPSA